MANFVDLLNYQIVDDIPSVEFSDQTIINTINPHSYIVAERDRTFKKALKQSDYLLPDGIGIVYAAKVIKNVDIPRITGPDFHIHLLKELNKKKKSCYYLGSTKKTLHKIENRISREFPDITVGSYSPPYKRYFSDEENSMIISKINSFQPDVLFVGMTAPKQEKWVQEHKHEINAKIICSIGAAFDYFAGTKNRSPEKWGDSGLEWLHRFVNEPKRLWKRNLISTPLFMVEIIKSKFTGVL